MNFSDTQRQAADAAWLAARGHPFLLQLVKDRLPHETFLFYLHQDAWFLREDAKVMAIAASRAPDLATAAHLSSLIAAVNAAEQGRHRVFAERLGETIDPDSLTPAPTAYAYVSHLRSVALDGSLLAILSALLPCPWLYSDFGRQFADREPRDPVFRDWLEPYKDEALAGRVRDHCALVDRLAERADEADRRRAAWAFQISIRYEVAFWEMAMTKQRWPEPA